MSSSRLCRPLLIIGLVVPALTATAGSLGGLARGFGAPAPSPTASRGSSDPAKLTDTFAKLPISFEANRGQTDPQVKFLARNSDHTLFLTPSEAVLSLSTDSGADSVLRMKMVGANSNASVSGAHELAGKVNYLGSDDSAGPRINAPTYARTEYKAVYPGIDMAWYGNEGTLEYDFVVAPGADPSTITLGLQGADSVHLDSDGDLVATVRGHEVRHHKPYLYQEIEGTERAVPGHFVLDDGNQVHFSVGSYDRSRVLIIDPILAYSTYLGGSGKDQLYELEADGAGNVWVAGSTESPDFPVENALQSTFDASAQMQGFVTKLVPGARGKVTLAYSTYLGGSSFLDLSEGGFAVDAAGSAYVAGRAFLGFPTTAGAYQTSPGAGAGNVGIIAKLSPDGSALAYSTFVSATRGSVGMYAIDVDEAGTIYLGGSVEYNNYADAPSGNASTGSAGPYQPTCALSTIETQDGPMQVCADGFLATLTPAGNGASDLTYFTYLAGGQIHDIDVDAGGVAYLTGAASSALLTTPGAFDRHLDGRNDAFVGKLDPAGNGSADLLYSTLLGGSKHEFPRRVAAGPGGTIYATGSTVYAEVGGATAEPHFPTISGAFQTTVAPGETWEGDGYLVKIDSSLPGDGSGTVSASNQQLVYSTLLGGARSDQANGLALGSNGWAYVAGSTTSETFPTKNPLQVRCYCFYDIFASDAFVAVVNPDPNDPNDGAGDSGDLIFATTLGGTGSDFARDVARDGAGNIYLAGSTNGKGTPPRGVRPVRFPVKNMYQRLYGGGEYDAFAAKITAP